MKKSYLLSLAVLAGLSLGSLSLTAHADEANNSQPAQIATTQVTATTQQTVDNQQQTGQQSANNQAAQTVNDQVQTKQHVSFTESKMVTEPAAAPGSNNDAFSYVYRGTWRQDSYGNWYLYGENGQIAKGDTGRDTNGCYWLFDDNGNYYRGQQGWYYAPNNYWVYFLNTNGQVAGDGWYKINGQWYAFSEGAMLANTSQAVPGNDNEVYSFDANGHYRTNTWVRTDNGLCWMYMQANGVAATGWRYINGSWYYFLSGEKPVLSWSLIHMVK